MQAVADCYKGQLPAFSEAISHRIDPGKQTIGNTMGSGHGFKKTDLLLSDTALLGITLVGDYSPDWAIAF